MWGEWLGDAARRYMVVANCFVVHASGESGLEMLPTDGSGEGVQVNSYSAQETIIAKAI